MQNLLRCNIFCHLTCPQRPFWDLFTRQKPIKTKQVKHDIKSWKYFKFCTTQHDHYRALYEAIRDDIVLDTPMSHYSIMGSVWETHDLIVQRIHFITLVQCIPSSKWDNFLNSLNVHIFPHTLKIMLWQHTAGWLVHQTWSLRVYSSISIAVIFEVMGKLLIPCCICPLNIYRFLVV